MPNDRQHVKVHLYNCGGRFQGQKCSTEQPLAYQLTTNLNSQVKILHSSLPGQLNTWRVKTEPVGSWVFKRPVNRMGSLQDEG